MSRTRGTREWADSNVNCYFGCSNNCRYCYARNMAFRFKRIDKYEDWEIMKPNEKAINKNYRKRKGRIMFPTSHDITIESFDTCIGVLRKLLESKNDVLITTKPYWLSIASICEIFKDYKDQIQFRFTITSKEDNILSFFEPNAPSFQDRLRALKQAFELGFETSLSLEPLLDITPLPIIDTLEKWVNGKIWIGIMSGKVPKELKKNYTIENLKKIYEECRNLPQRIINKIRFKDAFVNKLKLERNFI